MRVVEDAIDDHGLAVLAKQLSRAMGDLNQLEAEKAEELKSWKDRLGGQQSTIDRLRESIDLGKHVHDVECTEVMFPVDGVVRLKRKDTGGFLPDNHNRRMTAEEQQLPIPFGEDPNLGVELTWPEGAPFNRDHIVLMKERLEGVAIQLYKVIWIQAVGTEPGMPPGAELQKIEGSGEWTVTLVEYGSESTEQFQLDASSLRLAGDLDFDEKGVDRLIQEIPGMPAPAEEGAAEDGEADDTAFTDADIEEHRLQAEDAEHEEEQARAEAAEEEDALRAQEAEAESHDRTEAAAEEDDLDDDDDEDEEWDDDDYEDDDDI